MRGMNLYNHAVKAIICDVHAKAVEEEEQHQPIAMTDDLSTTLRKDSIQNRVVAAVAVISVNAYPFLALSDLICHFEERGD